MKAPYGPTKYFRHESVMQGTWDQLHEFNETILHLEVSHVALHCLVTT